MSITTSQRNWLVAGLVVGVVGLLLLLVLVVSLLLRGLIPQVAGFGGSAVPSLLFDGSNGVEIKSTRDLEFGLQPFTVSLWLRTTTARKNITFISKRADALGDGWGLFGQGDNQFLFYAAGGASPMSTPQDYRDGRWHHFAAVRHDSQVDLYYDGRLVGSGPEHCNFQDHHPIVIGMDGQGGHHLEGAVAEVRIYSRAMNQDDVARQWNDGKPDPHSGSEAGLVAGYHFAEGTGAVAKDFSGSGHDGVLVSDPIWAKR
jgi:hypothetical protein